MLVQGEEPVTEAAGVAWQSDWVRYDGSVYDYNENITTFLIMGIDKKDEGKKSGQADDGKQLTRNEKKEENTAKTEKVAVLEMQFYFDSSQFNPAQPYTVLISDKYCGERRFDVNPAAIR